MGKKQEDYTIHNVIRHTPKFLAETLDDTNKQEAFDSNIKYLNNIASSMTYAKVSARSFTNTFDAKPFYEYTPQEINQAIAKCLENPSVVAYDEQIQLIEQSKESKLMQYDTTHINNEIDRLERTLSDRQNDINYNYEQINMHLSNMTNAQKRLDEQRKTLDSIDESGYNLDISDSIKEVINSGKWLYLGSYHTDDAVADDKLRPEMLRRSPYNDHNKCRHQSPVELSGHVFLATEKTTCSHVDRDKNAVQRANFGNVLVCLKSSGQVARAFFALDAYASFGVSLHPHLNSAGEVCWGNAGSAYTNMVKDSRPNYLPILTLFTSLMETYSPDNPYQKLSTYVNKNVVKRHPVLINNALLSKIPQSFLEQALDPAALAEHTLIEMRLEMERRYLKDTSPQHRQKWKQLPEGLIFKLNELSIKAKDTFNNLIGDADTSLADISPEDVVNVDDLTDEEWKLFNGITVSSMSKAPRTYLLIMNYLRYKAGKQYSAIKYHTSTTRWLEFTPNEAFTWLGGENRDFSHFHVDTNCFCSSVQEYQGNSYLINHPDDYVGLAPTFDDYFGSKMEEK